MLKLSRRVGELIRIGKEIRVKVLSISGQQVKLGISAPRNMPVDREEIYLAKQARQVEVQGKRSMDDSAGDEVFKKVDLCTEAIGLMLPVLAERHTPTAVVIALALHATAALKVAVANGLCSAEKAALLMQQMEDLEFNRDHAREWNAAS